MKFSAAVALSILALPYLVTALPSQRIVGAPYIEEKGVENTTPASDTTLNPAKGVSDAASKHAMEASTLSSFKPTKASRPPGVQNTTPASDMSLHQGEGVPHASSKRDTDDQASPSIAEVRSSMVKSPSSPGVQSTTPTSDMSINPAKGISRGPSKRTHKMAIDTPELDRRSKPNTDDRPVFQRHKKEPRLAGIHNTTPASDMSINPTEGVARAASKRSHKMDIDEPELSKREFNFDIYGIYGRSNIGGPSGAEAGTYRDPSRNTVGTAVGSVVGEHNVPSVALGTSQDDAVTKSGKSKTPDVSPLTEGHSPAVIANSKKPQAQAQKLKMKRYDVKGFDGVETHAYRKSNHREHASSRTTWLLEANGFPARYRDSHREGPYRRRSVVDNQITKFDGVEAHAYTDDERSSKIKSGRRPLSKRGDASDADILNFALTLEHLESAFYTHGMEKYSSADFRMAGMPSWVRGRFEQIAKNEKTHVEFLESALEGVAVRPCQYSFPDTDVQSFVDLAFIFENVGTSAYNGAAAFLADKAYLTVAASILGVEARQAAWINSAVRKSNPWNTAFETPLDMNQAYTLASAFIVAGSCPSSNSPLPVHAFPTLTVPACESGGVVELSFDPLQEEQGQLWAAFIAGTGTVFVELSDKKVEVPKGLEGVVYVVVTKDGGSVRDETTVAGPVIVWFAFGSGESSK